MALQILFNDKKCIDGSYTHRVGFGPDSGHVSLHRRDFALLVQNFVRPFVPAGIAKVQAQPFSPHLVEQLIETVSRTAPRADPRAKVAEGTTIFGELIFDSRTSAIPGTDDPLAGEQRVVIPQAYLTESSFNEVMEDLLRNGTEHGVIEIGFTDIRTWWSDYGTVTGEFNIRKPDGSMFWDTLKTKEKPYTLLELINQFILPHLPGNYRVASIPSFKAQIIPENIRWQWEPAIKALSDLLNQYKLELCPNFDGTITLSNKNSQHDLNVLHINGLGITMPPPSSRLQGQRVHPAPAIVIVRGNRVLQNRFRELIPMMMDTDGRLKPIKEVLQRWRYPVVEALKQITVEEHRQYENVPGSNQRIKNIRRDCLKSTFCRVFALPSVAWADPHQFRIPDVPILERIAVGKGDESILDELIKTLGLDPAESEKSNRTGNQEVDLLPPRVFASQIVEKQIEDLTKLIPVLDDCITRGEAQVKKAEQYAEELLDKHSNTPLIRQFIKRFELSPDDVSLTELGKLAPEILDTQGFDENDLKKPLKQEVSQKLYDGPTEQILVPGSPEREKIVKRLKQLLDRREEVLDSTREQIKRARKVVDNWKALRRRIITQGRTEDHEHRWWTCLYAEVPHGKYHILKDRGLVIFEDPVIMTTIPMSPYKPHLTDNISSVGFAAIGYASEHKTNSPQDWTFVTFTRDGKGGIKTLGLGMPVFDTPRVIHDPNLTLYMDYEGFPFNREKVVKQAKSQAEKVLLEDPIELSVRYTHKGFYPIDLGLNGVTAVTWRSDGDTSKTVTEVNMTEVSMGGLGPKAASEKVLAGFNTRLMTKEDEKRQLDSWYGPKE